MDKFKLNFKPGFKVLTQTGRSQAAVMVLPPGDSTGGPENNHSDSDQWLYVESGKGTAVINENETALSAGILVLIKAGENHEIINTGEKNLTTINIYAPPAY